MLEIHFKTEKKSACGGQISEWTSLVVEIDLFKMVHRASLVVDDCTVINVFQIEPDSV